MITAKPVRLNWKSLDDDTSFAELTVFKAGTDKFYTLKVFRQKLLCDGWIILCNLFDTGITRTLYSIQTYGGASDDELQARLIAFTAEFEAGFRSDLIEENLHIVD